MTVAATGLPGGSVVKNPLASAGDLGLIPGLGRPPGGGHGSPLWYSCLENPMDRGAWRATVHGVTKNRTRLSMNAHALATTTYKDFYDLLHTLNQ